VPTILPLISLILSILLGLVAFVGWLVGRQKRYPAHCKIMAMAALANWLPILVVMIPSWIFNLRLGQFDSPYTIAPVVHGVIGMVAQVLMTYTVIRMNWLKHLPPRRTGLLMRVTMVLWAMTLFGGIGIYYLLYLM
jgi:uncharacterized membrane protein YozB (DUF420 family)